MAIFPPLSIGRDALLAHQRALQTTGNNIANVDTPGYSRQRTLLSAIPPPDGGAGIGVTVSGVDQAIDRFLEARRLASATGVAAATTEQQLVHQLEALFPVQDPGIGDALQRFFAATSALAVSPQDATVRDQLLGAADAVASAFRDAHAGIATLQRESDARLAQSVRDGNGLLSTIATLNREIVATEVTGSPANDLRDSRREALNRLAGLLQVNVVEEPNGAVSVFAASGAALVLGLDAFELTTVPDGTGLDGAPLSAVAVRDASGNTVELQGPPGGALGALVDVRDGGLPARAADLDLLATVLRDKVNAVQTDPAGRDLDGNVGSALFAGSGAGDLTLALTDPRGIAAAASTNPADNTNALALERIGSTAFAELGGATLIDHFAVFHAAIGSDTRDADDRAAVAETVATTLAAQRDAVSGVSLEEEFTDLIRFQRGFQAASQLIAVSNGLLDDLLAMVHA